MRIDNLRMRPDAGQRLFPRVIDDLAEENPNRVIYEFVNGLEVTGGFRKVTCWEYANAINRVSWFLDRNLGKATRSETLGYVGPGDIRYLVLTVAAVKTGRQMLFLSPKNSAEGHLAVLEGVNCNIWLSASRDRNGDGMEKVLDRRPMHEFNMLSLDDVLDPSKAEAYHYTKSFDEGKDDLCWVLHTSGSTGLPKPVMRYMSSTASNECHLLAGLCDGRPLLIDETIGARVYMTFPLFHSAGLSNGLLWPIFCDQTIILGPDRPLMTQVIDEMFDHTELDILLTAPSTVEDISKSESTMSRLPRLRAVSFGGGPLLQEVGDKIAARTKLILIMGTSEAGWLTCVDTEREDWNYLRFHPCTGLELRPHQSGLHELWAVRKPELAKWQTIFTTFPDLSEYCFKDLFSKHRTKEHLWHYEGRADNIIVLSNGEKFNPTSMELSIGRNRIVRSALVYGQGRFQISALIELENDAACNPEVRENAIKSLRPDVERANREAPRHAQLSLDYMILTTPEKPFLRAGKGTVQKKPTLDTYASELDKLYTDHETIKGHIVDPADLGALTEHLRSLAHRVTGIEDLKDDDDFFGRGADSLQAMTMLRHLQTTIEGANRQSKSFNVSIIYQNPSISSLSSAIGLFFLRNSMGAVKPATTAKNIEEMKAMLERHTWPYAANNSKPVAGSSNGVVVLTGSTGSLGSYILDQLLGKGDVSEIWCLNRSMDARERQTVLSHERGLRRDWTERNVHFRHAQLSKDQLGLCQADFDYLRQNVVQVIHNQWQVDFNMSLSSFEPHVAGVANLIALLAESSKRSSLVFTSSVGVAEYWHDVSSFTQTVPEEILVDLSTAGIGYGQSKMVAEHLLKRAHDHGVPATIVRIGQIAGPVGQAGHGMWNKMEWFPTIVEASRYIGLVPKTLGNQTSVGWLPVDSVARIIVELSLEEIAVDDDLRVFNVKNPRTTKWSELYMGVQSRMAARSDVTISLATWDDWLNALKSAVQAREEEAVVPGMQLMPFFETMGGGGTKFPEFDTLKAESVSPSLRGHAPISSGWMDLWMTQWGY